MNECWKILVLLLKAAYLGSVIDEHNEHEHVGKDKDVEEGKGNKQDDNLHEGMNNDNGGDNAGSPQKVAQVDMVDIAITKLRTHHHHHQAFITKIIKMTTIITIMKKKRKMVA